MIQDILEKINGLADVVENKEYKTKEELRRDMSIGLELMQQYIDALGEIIENELPLSDYVSKI